MAGALAGLCGARALCGRARYAGLPAEFLQGADLAECTVRGTDRGDARPSLVGDGQGQLRALCTQPHELYGQRRPDGVVDRVFRRVPAGLGAYRAALLCRGVHGAGDPREQTLADGDDPQCAGAGTQCRRRLHIRHHARGAAGKRCRHCPRRGCRGSRAGLRHGRRSGAHGADRDGGRLHLAESRDAELFPPQCGNAALLGGGFCRRYADSPRAQFRAQETGAEYPRGRSPVAGAAHIVRRAYAEHRAILRIRHNIRPAFLRARVYLSLAPDDRDGNVPAAHGHIQRVGRDRAV